MSVPPEVTDEHFLRQIAQLRERMLRGADSTPIRSLLITGVGPGHGATTVAANLAYSFCRATQSRTLLLGTHAGAAEDTDNLFASDVDIDGAVRPGGMDRLFLGAATLETGGTGQPLHTGALRERLDALRAQFAHIVIDMPPVAETPEVLWLVPAVDMVALVVQARRVKWQVVAQTQQALQDAEPRELGVIINRKRHYIPSRLYRWL